MAIEAYSDMRSAVRRAIRDGHVSLWSDDVLDRAISDARRDYAAVSGALAGSISVTATEDGILRMGTDFIAPTRMVGTNGMELPLYSWKYLHACFPDFRAVTGTELRGIIVDYDGYRNMRLFPKLEASDEVLGTLYYRRFPVGSAIENGTAILNHVLYQLLLIENKSVCFDYYSRFLADVNQEKVGKRNIGLQSQRRSGRFF